MDTRESRQPAQVVFAIAALLIIAAILTLRAVAHPVVLQPSSANPTPLGYTWSLLLFIIPIAALAWWFACRSDLKFPRAAFWRTIAILAPLGFVLDVFFGNAFFAFPNKPATLGIDIPARGGSIPIEDVCFAYSLGRIFQNRSGPHQLARIQFHLLPPAPDQPALGSDACSALRLVAISQRGDDRPEDRCVVRLTHRSALRLDGGELHHRDRLRGDQNLESARHARSLGVLWERRRQTW